LADAARRVDKAAFGRQAPTDGRARCKAGLQSEKVSLPELR
jgi:hypothetical protein